MARKGYPPEFRRRALDLVAAGKSARLLEVSDQSIYTWRRQKLIDRGELPGLSGEEREELRVARRRRRWRCRKRLVAGGSATVAKCRQSRWPRCRGGISRSLSGKRSRSFVPSVWVCARSRAD
jgi:transposase-like protein